MTLITKAMRDEYDAILQTKGREAARRRLFARLQMEHNRKWMNEHREEIEKELEEKNG
ncbi:MAG: hypothetical protein WC657_03800 [Candidatus Paceibacterota bacterium]|jgi:hypothetical protein